MYKFLVILAVVPAILAQTPIRPCPNGLPMPTAAFFGTRENHCTAEPCPLSRTQGFAATIVDFTPVVSTPSIRPHVRATVFGNIDWIQELPADVVNNPCGILTQGSCPIVGNTPHSYRLELPVDTSIPLISTDTEVTLFAANDQVIFCYRITNQITP